MDTMVNKKPVRVALNGCGRIGRAFLRQAQIYADTKDADKRGLPINIHQRKNQRISASLEVVAVNDLASREGMEYLLKYDSVYGKSDVSLAGIQYFSEKDPRKLPWKELGIDVVVEATGFFNTAEGAGKHLEAGAKRVIVTAPLKEPRGTEAERSQHGTDAEKTTTPQSPPLKGGEEAVTVLMGLNEEKLKGCRISSNASCTTNAAAPIIAILNETIGVEKAVLNTVHAYTATQSLVDAPAGKKGLREGRAAAVNIIPSSTGAAIAVTAAYPALAGKFDGISLRVPVLCGSIADITFIAKRNTNAEEVNEILRGAAAAPRWQGIFAVSEDELVSSDIIGRTEASIAELSMTRVVDGNLVKVLAWYDNEMGYASTLIKHVLEAGKHVL